MQGHSSDHLVSLRREWNEDSDVYVTAVSGEEGAEESDLSLLRRSIRHLSNDAKTLIMKWRKNLVNKKMLPVKVTSKLLEVSYSTVWRIVKVKPLDAT